MAAQAETESTGAEANDVWLQVETATCSVPMPKACQVLLYAIDESTTEVDNLRQRITELDSEKAVDVDISLFDLNKQLQDELADSRTAYENLRKLAHLFEITEVRSFQGSIVQIESTARL